VASLTDPLLEPFELKHLVLRNRIMSTSHAPAFQEGGHPRDRYRLYHEEKARGGIGLTMIGGSTNIALDSPSVFGQLYAGDDNIIPWFQKLTDGVRSHGAAVMCQITHMGRRTSWDDGHWLPVIDPSGLRERAHRSCNWKILNAWWNSLRMRPLDVKKVALMVWSCYRIHTCWGSFYHRW